MQSIDTFSHDVKRIVYRLCEDIATPRALTVFMMVKYGEWDQLSTLRCDPGSYFCASDYRRDVVITDLLRKCEDLPTSIDRKAAAIKTFWECESMCFKSNYRLSGYIDSGLPDLNDMVWRIILRARKMMSDTLGPCPDLFQGRFGPGATFGDRGQRTTVPDKMSSRPSLTSDAYPFLFQWTGTAWASACASEGRSVEFVRGNRFTTVPKDCTKYRGIAIEPSINVFYQLALGRTMKDRLRRIGLDLSSAQEIHKQVACEASISGSFATIDLSNASDTVCYNLVKLLAPPRWFEALASLRSPNTFVDGKWVRLEKFSSMGNGFTFELETCLFLSICSAVMAELGQEPLPGSNLFVFGDDIIVPNELAREVIAVLRFFGFRENVKKTFFSGNFRESCGGDYFKGEDVRPHYLKSTPNEPSEWIALANGFHRSAGRDYFGHFQHRYFHRARLAVIDCLPSRVRNCRGPKELGDLVLTDDRERWETKTRNSIRYIRVWRPAKYRRVSWGHFSPQVTLAAALYGVSSGSQDAPIGHRANNPGGVIPRDAVTGYKFGWVAYS